MHKGKEELKCASCEKSFLTEHALNCHKLTVHEGHKDGKCALCGKKVTISNLKKHVQRVHENSDKKDFCCEECGKSFKWLQTLNNHILSVHEGKNDHKCEVCGKNFFLIQNMTKHVREVHGKIKDYTCDSCGKSFFTNVQLKNHVKVTHEGRREYILSLIHI